MAGPSECSSQEVVEAFCAMGGLSTEADCCTAPGPTPSSILSSVEQQIERSKTHWSILAESHSDEREHRRRWWKRRVCCGGCMAEGEASGDAEASNVQEFLELQSHPTLGEFFVIFGDHVKGSPYESMGWLEVGEKFAEGAQAELLHTKVTWRIGKNNEIAIERGIEYALKVFKKGTYLKDLKAQLPLGLLQDSAMVRKHFISPTAKMLPRYTCEVLHGTLLEDGRFAFLMQKEHLDLRTLIECNMELRGDEACGPFSNEEAYLMMYGVALGVNWLHNHGIVHRDLKASNVLVQNLNTTLGKWSCYVADYECSMRVVGTGFFRAPEILQACIDKKTSERPEVFSREADTYSYGMICYEILTGKLPFEDHPLIDERPLLMMDHVINQGLRPEVPEYVEVWVAELLKRCWHYDPTRRPTFEEILIVLLANSPNARRLEDHLKERYGNNYKIGLHSVIDDEVMHGKV